MEQHQNRTTTTTRYGGFSAVAKSGATEEALEKALEKVRCQDFVQEMIYCSSVSGSEPAQVHKTYLWQLDGFVVFDWKSGGMNVEVSSLLHAM